MDSNFVLGNLSSVQESRGSFELLPKGDYALRAIEIKLENCKPTAKDPQGKYIDVQFEITEGPYEGRRVFQMFNIVNKNPEAVNIALSDIKQWIGATGEAAEGELTIKRIFDLEGRQCVGTLGVQKGKNGYEDKNVIKVFKVMSSQPQQQNSMANQQHQPQANSSGYQNGVTVNNQNGAPAFARQ